MNFLREPPITVASGGTSAAALRIRKVAAQPQWTVCDTMGSTARSNSQMSGRAGSIAAPPSAYRAQSTEAPKITPAYAAEAPENASTMFGLTGRSPVMRQLIAQMQRMAPHLTMVTLEGEDGTGKTLTARALHAAGPAAAGPFVPCLAGHFFAATEGHPNPRWSEATLAEARHGMLFLDRVHQLSSSQQETLADFLHWFDDRQFRADAYTYSDPDGEAATSIDLPAQIAFSSSVALRDRESPSLFRQDVASRLCAVRFRMPTLRERREDIPMLTQIFIQRFAREYGKAVRGLGPGTVAPLLRYAWPGNVRELEEVVTAACVETESQWIRPIDLPPLAVRAASSPASPTSNNAVESVETDLNLDRAVTVHVARVLQRTRGNKLRAAQLLGISRSTLYRILAAHPASPHQDSQSK